MLLVAAILAARLDPQDIEVQSLRTWLRFEVIPPAIL